MENKEYNLTFLPLFEEDLNAIEDYLTNQLHSPSSAQKLVDDVEKAIINRSKNPLGYPAYPSLKKRQHPYYTITVRNFTIFYVVIGDTMEIRRILYKNGTRINYYKKASKNPFLRGNVLAFFLFSYPKSSLMASTVSACGCPSNFSRSELSTSSAPFAISAAMAVAKPTTASGVPASSSAFW